MFSFKIVFILSLSLSPALLLLYPPSVCVRESVSTRVCAHVHAHTGQRTNCKSQYSASMVWVWGIELGSSDLAASTSTHLAAPDCAFSNAHLKRASGSHSLKGVS